MNIFIISDSPAVCARALDDKRITKMALESAQILAIALYIRGHEDIPYTPTYTNHPCVRWAAESQDNWNWLLAYLGELNAEYKRRMGRDSDIQPYSVVVGNDLQAIAKAVIPAGGMTEFANCTGLPDLPVFEAYKELLRRKWSDKKPSRWTNAQPPEWKAAAL